MIRPCRVGATVGPLFADDEEVADALLSGLPGNATPGTEVFVDMPAANAGATEPRTGRAMDPVFETVICKELARRPKPSRRCVESRHWSSDERAGAERRLKPPLVAVPQRSPAKAVRRAQADESH